MRFVFGVAVAVVLTTAAVLAQTPAPHPSHSPHAHASPSAHPTPFMTFANPASQGNGQHVMTGAGCNQQAPTLARNPITGQPQAQTFVSVPITKGGGSVASATNRAQQQQNCAQR